MGAYDWIASAVKCYGNHFPPEIIERTHHLLNVLENSRKYFPPQYVGKLDFLQAFMLHYFGIRDKETFEKAVKTYKASLETGNSANGYTQQIQSGKYHTIFHLGRLLKHPEAFGFDPDWAKPSCAE